MVCCNKIFSDSVMGHPNLIQVNAFLPPSTDFFWEITDAQGNIYNPPFTTDERGIGSIDTSLLPDGLINPHIGILSIKVKRNLQTTQYEKLVFLNTVEQVNITVDAGTGTKNYVGEVIPETIDSLTPFNFS